MIILLGIVVLAAIYGLSKFVQELLVFRISIEKSELRPLGRWSSQGVKMWCEEGLLQSGCYKTNSKSEETVTEDGKSSQNCLPVLQPVWPLSCELSGLAAGTVTHGSISPTQFDQIQTCPCALGFFSRTRLLPRSRDDLGYSLLVSLSKSPS